MCYFLLAVLSSLIVITDETGELLGKHIWDVEVLEETKGEFLTVHVRSLNRFTLDRICLSITTS